MIKIVEQEIEEYLKGFSTRDITMKLNGTSFLYKMGISYNGKIIRMFFDNGIDVTLNKV